MSKKKLEKLLEKLDKDEREEALEALEKLEESKATVGDDKSVSDEAFMEGAEAIAEAIAAKVDKAEAKVEVDDKKESKDFKRALHSFNEETDLDELEDMIADKAVPRDERLERYLQAKKENDTAYIKRVNRRVARYFQALINGETPVVRALVEGTDSRGGYLVPEEFRAEVVQELQNNTVMRNLATIFDMNTDTLDIPTETARPAVYWTAEDAIKATSSAEFGEVTLSPKKLVGRLPVTRELAADSAIAIVSYLTRVFAEEIGQAEDKAFFTGSGASQPRGLDQETFTTITAGGNKADSLINLFYSLKRAYRSRSTWVMNTSTIRNVRKLKDSQNQYLWAPSMQSGEPNLLLGRPVEEQNDIASGKIFFGDFSYYFIGDRQQLAAETTTEGGTAWERDRIEIKVVERVDGRTALTRAFVEGASF